MKRVLITGMSATGKSSVIAALRQRGYPSIDMDEPGWSEFAPDGEWRWCEDRVHALLDEPRSRPLFVAGCASNQARFYHYFEEIVLLTIPPDVLVERIRTRTTNDFGKRPGELDMILDDLAHVEPLLRRRATRVVDAQAPLDDVVREVLAAAGINE